ncbi:MAG: sulfatase-like hydrolase/transferase, partial [Puniceicoccales bacterium]
MSTNKPNLLFVFSDQHRWCDLGCYGNGDVVSPHFDAFAGEGLRLDQCYSHCPLCVPARGTLLTARHAMKHRAAANDLPIDSSLESVAHVLNRAGYQSGYIGKWHLAGVPREQAVTPENRLGFQHWKVRQCSHDYLKPEYHDEEGVLHQCPGYEPAVQTDLAQAFIREHQDQPWGLVLSWGPPHDPYAAVPDRYKKLFDPDKLSLRPNVPERIEKSYRGPLDRDAIGHDLAGYYAHIAALDEQFGRLVQHVKDLGLWENTLIVYTSDHGDLMGSQGFTQKQLPYEEAAHVPLLIGGGLPQLRQGTCSELIGLVDLFPTLLGALDLSYASDIDGSDLSTLLSDSSAKGREALYLNNPIPCHFGMNRGDGSWRAIRKGNYCYAMNLDNDADWFLYDLAKDPYQRENLLGKTPEMDRIARELRQELLCMVRAYDDVLPWEQLIA